MTAPRDGARRVIVLASFQEDERVIEAVHARALSYLPKTTAVDQVVGAVRAAAQGGSVFEPGTAALLARQVRDGGRARPLDVLSRREWDVLAGLARGRSNRQIAGALGVSEETVKSRLEHPGQAEPVGPDAGGHLRPAVGARPAGRRPG